MVLLQLASFAALSQSITLSPAVVPLSGQPGQSVSQVLSLRNDAAEAMEFELESQDVVVREGERAFVAAGELPGSIAASAVYSAARVQVPAGGTATARVTLTLPSSPSSRAVVVFFRATRSVATGERRALMSLGTLFTFTLSDRVTVEALSFDATPPTASTDLQLRLALANVGDEPAMPQGAAALLDESGALVGRVPFAPKRLLPGERTTVTADYTGELPTGTYRVIATLDVAGRPLTRDTLLHVP